MSRVSKHASKTRKRTPITRRTVAERRRTTFRCSMMQASESGWCNKLWMSLGQKYLLTSQLVLSKPNFTIFVQNLLAASALPRRRSVFSATTRNKKAQDIISIGIPGIHTRIQHSNTWLVPLHILEIKDSTLPKVETENKHVQWRRNNRSRWIHITSYGIWHS